jgi:hypothetical protein
MKAIALPVSLRGYCVGMIAAGMVLFSNQAAAGTVSLGSGTVAYLEATYMPGVIVFSLSSGDTLCPAGTILHYFGPAVDNMKAVYATLLANMMSERQIYSFYDTSQVGVGVPPGQCRVSYVGTR